MNFRDSKAIIFDLDGTLCSYIDLEMGLLTNLAKKAEEIHNVPDGKEYLKNYIDEALRKKGFYSWNEVYKDCGNMDYLSLLIKNKDRIKILPDVKEILKQLSEADFIIGILTNGAKNYTDWKLKYLELEEYRENSFTTTEFKSWNEIYYYNNIL